MGFRVLTSAGNTDKTKTNRLKRQLQKSCDKITKTIETEVKKFKESATTENLDDNFWMHAAHRAMLYMSRNQDVYVSADVADLFASDNIASPAMCLTSSDIDRLEKIKEKHDKKMNEKKNG